MSEDGDEPDSGVVTLNCSDEVPTSSKIRNSGGILAGGQNQSLYLDQVLDNVLENVLLFLTNRRDRNSASLVCKSWYRAEALTRSEVFIGNCYAVSPRRTIERFPNIRSVTLKGRPRFSDFNMMPINWGAFFSPWCAALASAYNGLQKIRLKRLTITDDDLDLLAHSFRLLEELVLVCSEGFGTSGLAIVAGKCKRLRVLDLIEDEVSDDEIDWLSCFPEGTTNLESLIFDCVDCATNAESIALLVSRSPNLKKLRLSRFVSIDQLYRLMIQAPKLTDLGTGSFSSPEIGMFPAGQEPDYASAFSGCGSLVCLSGFREIAPNYLPAIYPSCPNLVSLNFSYANITTDQLKSVIFHCHKLRTFWVLDSVCDDGLKAVAEACKDLQEIRVFPMDAQEGEEGPVSEIGLQAISEGCRKLRSILYFCQRMTNAAVVSMSVNCSDLEVFRLCIMGRHQPDHLTQQPMDQGFGAIVMNCKKLTRLAVSGLLTDNAFKLIGEYGKSVRTLSVAFAGDSDSALKHVLRGCGKLEKLEIRDCPFGDSALRSGLHHYYSMRFLWMSSCKLTRHGCQDIARSLPRLVTELIDADAGEDDGISEFAGTLYMYRSLEGRRHDAPDSVTIL